MTTVGKNNERGGGGGNKKQKGKKKKKKKEAGGLFARKITHEEKTQEKTSGRTFIWHSKVYHNRFYIF